jgi:hypothetical protein
MQLPPALEQVFRINISAGMVKGFHSGGHYFHRGAGVAFGGKLLMFGLGTVFILTLAVMAMQSASNWVKTRYSRPDYSRAAGFGVFVIVVLVLGFAMARFL